VEHCSGNGPNMFSETDAMTQYCLCMALKIVEKKSGQHGRLKMLKEIETFHHCQGHENILQLIEYFEEDNL